MVKRKYQICNCCVMDTTDEYITFDENGVCTRCNEYKQRILPKWNYGKGHEEELKSLLAEIKRKGRNQEYDCILGLSGGLDSTYMLHLAVKEWGLKPFVFHINAGWNLPVAEENIKKVTEKLGVKLHVENMNWNEMKEMQLAWFKTGLENLDSPQDHAFIALIDRYSRELGVKYILNGYNISTEIVADPESSIDAKIINNSYKCVISDGNEIVDKSPTELAKEAECLGVGEVIINSVDRDGMMQGYDIQLVRGVVEAVKVPVTAIGGAGGIGDLKMVLEDGHAHTAAGGSMFVYYGKLKAVLITAPSEQEFIKKGIYSL